MFMGLVCKRLTVKASVLFRAAEFHFMGYVGLVRVKTCVGLLGVKFLMSFFIVICFSVLRVNF